MNFYSKHALNHSCCLSYITMSELTRELIGMTQTETLAIPKEVEVGNRSIEELYAKSSHVNARAVLESYTYY